MLAKNFLLLSIPSTNSPWHLILPERFFKIIIFICDKNLIQILRKVTERYKGHRSLDFRKFVLDDSAELPHKKSEGADCVASNFTPPTNFICIFHLRVFTFQ